MKDFSFGHGQLKENIYLCTAIRESAIPNVKKQEL